MGFSEGLRLEEKVWQAMREVLDSHGLEAAVYRIGLDFDVGPQGKHLDARQRAAVDLARCLVRRPGILVVDGSFSVYDGRQARAVMAEVRRMMHDATLIAGVGDPAEAEGFDQLFLFEGQRIEVVAKNDVGGQSLPARSC